MLKIEYDGTNYVGWQRQPNGLSVQQVVEDSLAKLLGEVVPVQSSGRTDSGVHARGMVASFNTDKKLPMTAYREGMNCILPPDVAVMSAEEVAPGFNPRHDAKGKHYRYCIYNSPLRSPVARLYAWQVRERLDIAAMREGAAFFVGEHDFAAFRTSGCAARTTIRRIDAVEITAEAENVIIDVYGSGFMRNMVRIMVGTLVAIGSGRISPSRIRDCLSDPSLQPGATAPAQGLTLMEVFY